MTPNNHEYFEEIEIEHDYRTYYASGYIEYTTTTCIGTNYEGYEYEILLENKISDITISHLWYYDKDSGNYVHIQGQNKYKDIEELALEEIRYRFE